LRVPEGNEPLIAVFSREDQAVEIERRLVGSGAAVRVSWEELPVRTAAGDVHSSRPDQEVLHIVSIGGHEQGETVKGLPMEGDPIGLGVFDSLDEALAFAAEQSHSHVRVRSLPVGWVDPEAAG
jgi:hypothetical protein